MSNHLDDLGARLRQERARAGLSQRELARRIGSSASLISQLESGSSKPSVGTLYAIVTELGISLDRVVRGHEYVEPPLEQAPMPTPPVDPSVHPSRPKAVGRASGVRREQLTSSAEADAAFIEAIYELGFQFGFTEYELGPGDSIAFDSTTPHRLFNKGNEPVHAVWLVVGRAADARTES